SVESAAHAVRALFEREGWWTPPGKSPRKRARETAAARVAIAEALAAGTWDRVVEQGPIGSQRRVFDEAVVREAAWLYFYDELGFGAIAERLLPRTRSANASALKGALLDEWNRRGWPRRTARAAGRWTPPDERARCSARRRDG